MSLKSILGRLGGNKGTSTNIPNAKRFFKSDFVPHMPNVKPRITRLDSGLRVVTNRVKSPISTVGIFMEMGSINETEENNGTSIFLQNVSLQGTKNRKSQIDIDREIQSIGASLKAYTSREQVSYIGQTFNNENIPKLVDIMTDIIQNPKLDNNDIEKVRSNLLKEKEIIESQFEETIMDFIHSAAFQGSSLALPVLGETKSIESITKETLESYISSHYSKQRMVISVNGDIDHDSFVSMVDKSLNNIPDHSSYDLSSLSEFEFIGSEITVNDNTMNHVYGSVAFQAPSLNNPDYFPLLLIQNMMGVYDKRNGGGNSLVPYLSEISFDQDLCESYKTYTLPYNRTGLFGVYFKSRYDRVDDFSRRMMQELRRLRGMTDTELEMAKLRVMSSILRELDNNESLCEHFARQVISYGDPVSIHDFLKNIDNITTKDIKRVYDDYLRDVDPVVSAYGNLKYYPDYNNFRSWTT